MLKLDKTPVVIKKGAKVVGATTVPKGKGVKAARVTEMEVILAFKPEKGLKAFDKVFPSLADLVKLISSREDCKGFDASLRTKLPDLHFEIFHGDDESAPAVLKFIGHTQAKAKLSVDDEGNVFFVIKPRGKFTKDELALLGEFSGGEADVKVSAEPAQMDLADTTLLSTKAEPEKKATKPVKLHAVDDGQPSDALSG